MNKQKVGLFSMIGALVLAMVSMFVPGVREIMKDTNEKLEKIEYIETTEETT